MKSEIQNLVTLLKQTFEKGAWHGPALMETLNGVNETQAFKRLPGTHNIIELVAHMAAWKMYTIKKLRGDTSYKVTDELNFPKLANWDEALRLLRESQNLLLSAVETFPSEKLQEEIPGSTDHLTFYSMIHGIIQHDLYHAGQIFLIKKAMLAQTI